MAYPVQIIPKSEDGVYTPCKRIKLAKMMQKQLEMVLPEAELKKQIKKSITELMCYGSTAVYFDKNGKIID